MADLATYITWRGDLSLAERGFNQVDNVILSLVAYLDLATVPELQTPDGGIELHRAVTYLLELAAQDAQNSQSIVDVLTGSSPELTPEHVSSYVRSVAHIGPAFLEALVSSERYGHSYLHHFEERFDAETPLQFTALCVDIAPDCTYVAFRGTDSTVAGWREDFTMSYAITPAQREAARYLAEAVSRAQAKGQKVLVGGHSKGGVLAAYAAYELPDELLTQVEAIYSNDGPDMDPCLLPSRLYDRLGAIYHSIVPTYSIVGMLLADERVSRTIVQSSAKGSQQHDAMSWEVGPGGFIVAADFDDDCKTVQQTIASWNESMSQEDRRHLVTILFDALSATGAELMGDALSSVRNLGQFASHYTQVDAHARELISRLIGTWFEGTKQSLTESISSAVAEHTAPIKNVAQVVRKQLQKVPQHYIRDRDEQTSQGSMEDGGEAHTHTKELQGEIPGHTQYNKVHDEPTQA